MAGQLDIDLLRCFVAVADAGALSRAATRVGRSQAAVSMQMARLESIVGKPLLNRTGRGVSMTLYGSRLLSHAHRILGLHDEALAEMSGGRLTGSLRFGCPDDYATAFLPVLLSSFAQFNPHVSIEVVCASTPRLVDRLDRRGLDLALISVPGDITDPVLRYEDLVWVASQNRQEALHSSPVRLALGDVDTLDHGAAVRALSAAGCEYQIAYSSGSLSGLLAVVRSGQAVAVLTRSTVPADLRIIQADIRFPKLPSVGLTTRMDMKLASTVTRAFEAHVRSMLPTL